MEFGVGLALGCSARGSRSHCLEGSGSSIARSVERIRGFDYSHLKGGIILILLDYAYNGS